MGTGTPAEADGSVFPRRSAQLRVRLPGQGAWSLVLFKLPLSPRVLGRDCVPEEECFSAGEVARSGGLEPGCLTKYHEVPGGSDGTVCLRRSAQLRVRLPGQGAWSLVLFQITIKSQGAQTGVCARGGVL